MTIQSVRFVALAACFAASAAFCSTTADYTADVQFLSGNSVIFSGQCPAHFSLDGADVTAAIYTLDCPGQGEITVNLSATGDGKHVVHTADGSTNQAYVMWQNPQGARVSFGHGRSVIFTWPKEGES
ncbi:hypothetical protein JFN94_24720 [Burkholderia anthina]|uniref:Lipoprotein n=1 Tax=Burkholderia anthina TaxID=179879 RepID=A0A7T7AJB9_9BURK|nr:hypothetical protein [Burkholderia anthina]QQK04562.1 hypothetical protein JFN94_24720 [Burkholderia anthina]